MDLGFVPSPKQGFLARKRIDPMRLAVQSDKSYFQGGVISPGKCAVNVD
jgi:hypothetical protein